MVAIVTGASLGLGRTSVAELGSAGELGPEGQAGYSSNVGLFGENVYVNAANGNLVVERTDEILTGVGLDDDLTSVYNSLYGSGATAPATIGRPTIRPASPISPARSGPRKAPWS